MPIMLPIRERSITQLKNYLDLRNTAPTRPPPNTTGKVSMTAKIRMSYLGEVPAWAEGAQTTIKMPSPLGRVPVRVEGQVNMPINHLCQGEVHPLTSPSFHKTPQLQELSYFK